KGRANYLCQRRTQQVLAEGRQLAIDPRDRLAYAALASCARLRAHGEVGTLPGALLSRFPALRDLRRRAVAPRAEHCTREQCAAESACPLGRRRAALARAQLVVANHDLLLRWPPDYPNFTHVIADEAHELAGVADEAYATELRQEDLFERLDELFGGPARRTPPLLRPRTREDPRIARGELALGGLRRASVGQARGVGGRIGELVRGGRPVRGARRARGGEARGAELARRVREPVPLRVAHARGRAGRSRRSGRAHDGRARRAG